MFQESFEGVSQKFQGCFKKVSGGVLRKLQVCCNDILRIYQDSFKGVSRKIKGCFKEVSRMI